MSFRKKYKEDIITYLQAKRLTKLKDEIVLQKELFQLVRNRKQKKLQN